MFGVLYDWCTSTGDESVLLLPVDRLLYWERNFLQTKDYGPKLRCRTRSSVKGRWYFSVCRRDEQGSNKAQWTRKIVLRMEGCAYVASFSRNPINSYAILTETQDSSRFRSKWEEAVRPWMALTIVAKCARIVEHRRKLNLPWYYPMRSECA